MAEVMALGLLLLFPLRLYEVVMLDGQPQEEVAGFGLVEIGVFEEIPFVRFYFQLLFPC